MLPLLPNESCRRTVDDDLRFLRSVDRPEYESGFASLSVVDLFAGCGGLTLGVAEAAHRAGMALEVPLAVDFAEAPARVFAEAFPKASVAQGAVENLFDGELRDPLTPTEHEVAAEVEERSWRQGLDLLVGGPPCQGHSDLNNRSRRDDPRNALYVRMARAAEVLVPRAVIIENVPAVVHDKGGVVEMTRSVLADAGFAVADDIVRLDQLGVPQRRRRHVLLAVRSGLPDPAFLLEQLVAAAREPRDLAWAIEDLIGWEGSRPFDESGRLSPRNKTRIDHLFEYDVDDLPNALRPRCHQGDHSYVSMYGRLCWDRPAQTITSGYGSMGQGRYVHPSRRRTLTPHEAARLQFFPDWYPFDVVSKRGAWAEMIGNAVPPKLTMAVTCALIDHGLLRAGVTAED
jgi:DNA (cytosine-5)-methyltransferase 1